MALVTVKSLYFLGQFRRKAVVSSRSFLFPLLLLVLSIELYVELEI